MLAQLDITLQPLGVRHQADLHEDTFQLDVVRFTGGAVGVVKATYLAVLAHHLGGLARGDDLHVVQAAQFLLQHFVCTHLLAELDQGNVANNTGQVDGCFNTGVTTADDRHALAFEQRAVAVRAVGHALVTVLFFTRHTHLAPAGTGGQNKGAGLQRGTVGQLHFVQAARLRCRDQLFGALHVHDVDFVFVNVLLHGRDQLRAFGVRHGNQVLDTHGIAHLATETLSRNTGGDPLTGRVDRRRSASRATTDDQNFEVVFLVQLLGLFLGRVGVQLGYDFFQRHAALPPGLAVQVHTRYRHHFTLLDFVLEQGTVDGGVLDVRIEHAHQVQGLYHVRAVLAGQGEVGFELELAVQLLNLLDQLL